MTEERIDATPERGGRDGQGDEDLGILEILGADQKTFPMDDPERAPHIRLHAVGEPEDGDLHIFIRRSLLKEIIDYSNSVTSREIGGVLIGNHFQDGERDFIEIELFLAAEHAEEMPAALKFTHETWSAVTKKWDEAKESRPELENSVMVGWHHTHPSYGIFLSSHDRFIHEGYFNLEFQVALVVDPVARRFGFFQWKDRGGERRALVDSAFYCIENA